MNAIFKKLQFKDQDSILVSKAPAEFQDHLNDMKGVTRVVTRAGDQKRYPFAIFFVQTCADITRVASSAVASAEEDGLLWFAYPKKSSKRYDSDIGRDDSWQLFGDLGYEGVRMVAIDADWTALRLRHVDHIKTLRRDPKRAMSAKGKRRASK